MRFEWWKEIARKSLQRVYMKVVIFGFVGSICRCQAFRRRVDMAWHRQHNVTRPQTRAITGNTVFGLDTSFSIIEHGAGLISYVAEVEIIFIFILPRRRLPVDLRSEEAHV